MERALSWLRRNARRRFSTRSSAPGLIRAGVLESELSERDPRACERVSACGATGTGGSSAADLTRFSAITKIHRIGSWRQTTWCISISGRCSKPGRPILGAPTSSERSPKASARRRHRRAFRAGKQYYRDRPHLTAGELYDFVCGLALASGWIFAAPTAGHLIGQFPHERAPAEPANSRSAMAIH